MAEAGGDWLGMLGLLGAAAISSAGAIYNNRAQEKLQKQVNSMAIDLADSAHQREVIDLYKAGLNPILSATGNGASVPSLGTPRLDNVLDSFGSSARSVGDMMSKQRSLTNKQIEQDVDYIDKTQSAEINAAKAEARARADQASYDAMLAGDKAMVLDQLSRHHIVDENGKEIATHVKKDYLDDLKDSVKAEIKEPGTRYLQSWIHTGGKAVGDVINGATGVKNLMRKQPKGVYNRRVDPRGRVSTSWTEYK